LRRAHLARGLTLQIKRVVKNNQEPKGGLAVGASTSKEAEVDWMTRHRKRMSGGLHYVSSPSRDDFGPVVL